jgi:hypothetical protein
MDSRMSITLNARLRPLDRGARYEIPTGGRHSTNNTAYTNNPN